MKLIDLTGQTFGRLTVVAKGPFLGGHRRWNCVCQCGNTTSVASQKLRSGNTRSCGCLHDEVAGDATRTHGMAETSEYRIWTLMKDRCLNANTLRYEDYGNRGITVCDEWRNSFEAFYRDMGPKPTTTHSLERKENNGPYCKANCIWATKKAQARNRRSSRRVTIDNVSMTIAEWAEISHVDQATMRKRFIRSGLLPQRST